MKAVQACLLFAVVINGISSKRERKHFCKLPQVPENAEVEYRKFNGGKASAIGSKIVYSCPKGFVRNGPRKIKCLWNKKWSSSPPACKVDGKITITSIGASSLSTIKLVNFVLSEGIKTNEAGICKQTKPDDKMYEPIILDHPNGLDIIFLLDSSSSIGKNYFTMAKRFVSFVIEKFGVHSRPGGTRIGAIAFNSVNRLVYDFGTLNGSSVKKAKKRIMKIPFLGGQNGLEYALNFVISEVRLNKSRNIEMIIISDGKYQASGDTAINLLEHLRFNYNVAVHAIGIGREIEERLLQLLVNKDDKKHVMRLCRYTDFKSIFEMLTYKDYSKCGEGYVEIRSRERKNQWPWAVAVYTLHNSHYQYICGGSFIRNDLILTAAHCLTNVLRKAYSLQEKQYRIVAGVTKIKRTTEVFKEEVFDWILGVGLKVRAVHVHPNFTLGTLGPNDFRHDIAIIQLEQGVTWSPRIRPICLPNPWDYLKEQSAKKKGLYGYVAGWGIKSGDDRARSPDEMPEELRFVRLGVKSNKTCKEPYFFKKTMFCASDREERPGPCKGDAGVAFAMPLPMNKKKAEAKYKIMGIVSWGPKGCHEKNSYGYYTRVTNYLDWIKETMKKLA